jgi:hypothetical protein
LIFSACSEKAEKRTVISGQIIATPDSLISLHGKYLLDTGIDVPLVNGKFHYSFNLNKDTIIFISTGWFLVTSHVSPGDSLHLYADYRKFDQTAYFSGRGHEISNLWLDMYRMNTEKSSLISKLYQRNDTFNIQYIVGGYRTKKQEILKSYLKKNPGLINTPLKQMMTDYYMFMDDWTSYEKYNYKFPDHPVRYEMEFPFKWEGRHPNSYMILRYGYQYFLTRYPVKKLTETGKIREFLDDIEKTIPDDTDLRETLKLVYLINLLRRNFFNMDKQDCSFMKEKVKGIFKGSVYSERFDKYLKAYSISIKGGKFPSFPAFDLFCNSVDISRFFRNNRNNLLITVPDIDSLIELEPLVRKLKKEIPGAEIYFLFTDKISRNRLIDVLADMKLNLGNIFYFKNHDLKYYNFYRHSHPVIFVVDGNLTIKSVISAGDKKLPDKIKNAVGKSG